MKSPRKSPPKNLQVIEAGPADDRFVFAFSDANFERYGITGQAATGDADVLKKMTDVSLLKMWE